MDLEEIAIEVHGDSDGACSSRTIYGAQVGHSVNDKNLECDGGG